MLLSREAEGFEWVHERVQRTVASAAMRRHTYVWCRDGMDQRKVRPDRRRYGHGMGVARDTRVELSQLAAFVAVASELSFSRAADRLQTTQPPVSRLIRRLEDRLGVALFERTSHSVVLTAAGESLVPSARAVLAAKRGFDEAAAGLLEGGAGLLRIGTTEGAGRLLAAVIERFAVTHPDVELRLEPEHTLTKLARLREGSLDAAFVRNPPASDALRTLELVREPLVAVVSDRHPLAERARVWLRELADDPLLVTPAEVNPGVNAAVLALAAKAGFEPRIGPPFFNAADAVAQIAVSRAWTLLARSNRPLPGHGVVVLELDDPTATVGVALAWRPVNGSTALRGFVDAARSIVERPIESQDPAAVVTNR